MQWLVGRVKSSVYPSGRGIEPFLLDYSGLSAHKRNASLSATSADVASRLRTERPILSESSSMSAWADFGSLFVSAVIPSACATGAQPQPLPDLPAPTIGCFGQPHSPVPEPLPRFTPSAPEDDDGDRPGDRGSRLVPLPTEAPTTARIPAPNPALTSVSTRHGETDGCADKTAPGLHKVSAGWRSAPARASIARVRPLRLERHQVDVPLAVAEQFQVGEKSQSEDIQKAIAFFQRPAKAWHACGHRA
jgi:hypothetical protein